MKNFNVLSIAGFLILTSFIICGYWLIEDVFKASILNKIIVIPLVSMMALFFLVFLFGQNEKIEDRIVK